MTPREEAIIRTAYADGLQTGWAISEYDGDINTSGLADEYINEAIADNGGTAAQMICTDAPDDDHKAALAEKELALADYERITTLQMAQNRRQEAELEKARELLRRAMATASYAKDRVYDRDLWALNKEVKAYLGDKS